MEGYCIRKHQILFEDTKRIRAKVNLPAWDERHNRGCRPAEMNLTGWLAGEMVLSERGELLDFDSNEMSLERFCAVNDIKGERFELYILC